MGFDVRYPSKSEYIFVIGIGIPGIEGKEEEHGEEEAIRNFDYRKKKTVNCCQTISGCFVIRKKV